MLGRVKSSMKKRISGTHFENYLYPTVRKHFPLNEGFIIRANEDIWIGNSKIRPDFCCEKRKVYAVIDAKDKAYLEPKDIDQIGDYKKKTKASQAIIYIANDTEVPQTVKDYANDERIEIRRTLWRMKPKT